MWFSKTNFPVEGKTALIVGASQGIGVNLAERLYEKNCSTILVAEQNQSYNTKFKTSKKNTPSLLPRYHMQLQMCQIMTMH